MAPLATNAWRRVSPRRRTIDERVRACLGHHQTDAAATAGDDGRDMGDIEELGALEERVVRLAWCHDSMLGSLRNNEGGCRPLSYRTLYPCVWSHPDASPRDRFSSSICTVSLAACFDGDVTLASCRENAGRSRPISRMDFDLLEDTSRVSSLESRVSNASTMIASSRMPSSIFRLCTSYTDTLNRGPCHHTDPEITPSRPPNQSSEYSVLRTARPIHSVAGYIITTESSESFMGTLPSAAYRASASDTTEYRVGTLYIMQDARSPLRRKER